MLASESVQDAEAPALEVREHAADPLEDFMRRPVSDRNRRVVVQPSARVGQCLETPVRLTTDVNDPSSAGKSTGCGQSRPRAGHPPTAQEGIVHKLSML